MVDELFGEWLKRTRKAKGLTQKQLAAQVNCSTSTLRKIEAGERRVSVQMLELFADIINVPVSERRSLLEFARSDLQIISEQYKEKLPALVVPPRRSNIPSSVTSLIGRELEVAEICAYLMKPDIRLVTLIGSPGIGKTRLSLEVARNISPHFSDGVFFVSLAPLDNSSLIAPAIIQTLGYVDAKIRPALEQIVDGLGDKQTLLVLDNFEHLMDGSASLVSDLLSSCSRLKIIVTSRESLRVSGEWLYPVSPLRTPEANALIDMESAREFPALMLFAERARAVRPDFSLRAENIQAVASICAQLDGLPLAIELIAPRLRIMSPQLLLDRLKDQFVLSADGMRPESMRQKTLNNAIGWSYNSLPDDEQNLFIRFSVFSGRFTLEAAEAIFSKDIADRSVPNLITSILDKSLLQRAPDTHGEMCFTMLVTIQQFARERLNHAGLEHEMRDRHLAYFLELAEKADQEIHGPAQLEWGDRLENDHDNFHAALEWCLVAQDAESALRLLGALCWQWNIRSHYMEIKTWFDKIRLLPKITDYPAGYARLLDHIAHYKWVVGDFRDAQILLEESRKIWLNLGNEGEPGLADTLDWLGMVARWSKGDNDTAHQFFSQSFELYKKHSDQRGMTITMFHLAIVEDDLGHSDLALSLYKRSLMQLEQLGDLWGIARLSQILGQYYLKQGNYEMARKFFERHLEIDESLHFKEGVVVALRSLGNFHRYQGGFDQAKKFLEKSLEVCREYNLKDDMNKVLYFMGLLNLQRNDYLQASQYFTEFFELARTVYERINAGDLFIGLAAVAAGTNRPERAVKLFGAAQGAIETMDNRFSLFDRLEFDRHIQIARDQLGTSAFDELTDTGRLMTVDQALVFALEA